MSEQHSQTEEYENPYKFNGKELDQETGLYYYGARYYDPRVSIWMGVDPLMESFPNANPYNYCLENPVNFVDPDDRSASPIYDYEGNFMGTDDQGFSGDVIFMDPTIFRLSGGYNNGTDNSQKGGISHGTAMRLGERINGIIGSDVENTYTQKDSDMLNKVINHIASQMPEVDMTKLLNGKVSNSYWEDAKGLPKGKSSNGAKFTLTSVADTRKMESGKSKVSFYLDAFTGRNFTVENLQNTMIHEFGGHHTRKYPASYGPEHAKAIELQRSHSTWKNTTQNFKDNINGLYNDWMGIN